MGVDLFWGEGMLSETSIFLLNLKVDLGFLYIFLKFYFFSVKNFFFYEGLGKSWLTVMWRPHVFVVAETYSLFLFQINFSFVCLFTNS